ncbi:hypothetical protein Ancab_013826 [Ancistrocladus abbreviatus]
MTNSQLHENPIPSSSNRVVDSKTEQDCVLSSDPQQQNEILCFEGPDLGRRREIESGMVLSAKSKNSGEGWGMGFLLIFFPEDDSSSFPSKKTTLFSFSSSSTVRSARPSSTFHPLLSKTQSTLSICALLVFTTFLFFTLSTFEPTLPHRPNFPTSRRLLRKSTSTPSSKQRPRRINTDPSLSLSKIPNILDRNSEAVSSNGSSGGSHRAGKRTEVAALQGMGTLYRRGTGAMGELIVGHVSEDVEERELRSFLRILHFIGLLAKSDLVLIFSNSISSSSLSSVVEEESESLLKLVQLYGGLNETVRDSGGNDGLSRYLRIEREEERDKQNEKEKEAVWGKATRFTRSARSNSSHSDESERLSYGSVVGFQVSELDPENSLSGFLDRVPLSLRRWACYPMLLGRVRRNFKHIMLVDVKDLLVLKDPFVRIRNRNPKSLFLLSDSATEPDKRGKGNPSKTRDHHDPKPLNTGLIIGGDRGVRRFADAVLMEIVRDTVDHKELGSTFEIGSLGPRGNWWIGSFFRARIPAEAGCPGSGPWESRPVIVVGGARLAPAKPEWRHSRRHSDAQVSGLARLEDVGEKMERVQYMFPCGEVKYL